MAGSLAQTTHAGGSTGSAETPPTTATTIRSGRKSPTSSGEAGSAGYGMRFAVRRCAGEAVPMVGDPAVDRVLDEPDAGDAVDQQRQPGAQSDRPRSVPRLGTAV